MTSSELDPKHPVLEGRNLESRQLGGRNFEGKVQYYVAQSLDGFIADASHSLDWLMQFDGAPGVKETHDAFLKDVGALVMGAVTYEFLLQ